MKKLILSGLIAVFASVMSAPVTNAVPGQCVSTPYGGFCDSYAWQDGSFNHCESAMGFSNCYTACIDPASGRPFPTDMDPNTPCP